MKNFKSKLENYWYYHKTATILVIVFVCALAMLISAHNDNLPQDGKVSVITQGYVSTKQINFDDLVNGKISDLNNDGIYSLNVNEIVLSGDQSSSEQTSISQVLASFSTGDTGLYIFDKTNLDRFMVYDAFEPLENLLSEEILNERQAYSKDGKIYAVSLAGCGLTENYEFITDDLYAAVIFDRPIEDFDEKTKQLADNSKTLLTELLK